MASNTKSIESAATTGTPKAKRDLFLTEKINRLGAEMALLRKSERL